MLKKIITLVYVLILISIKQISLRAACQHELSEYIFQEKDFDNENITWTIINYFEDFNDITIECNQTYNFTEYVTLWPRKPLILDKSFKLNKLMDENQVKSINYFFIGNLKGIDLNSKPFIRPKNRFQQKTAAYLFFSKLDAYSNSLLIDSDKCDLETYNTTSNYLQYFYGITIYDVYYPKKWCPYFFKNFDLAYIVFFDIKNSFLMKNRVNFHQLNSSNIYLKYLLSLQLIMTFEVLDQNNLSPDLFKNVEILGLAGIIYGTQDDLFKDFQKLKIIDFAISNLKYFFHLGNKWMNYLNLNVSKINMGENSKRNLLVLKFIYLKQTVSFDLMYEYPNEDLCLFKDFPHERFVFPLIIPGKQLECTCTLYWLQSNIHRYKNELKVVSDYKMNYHDRNELNSFKIIFKFCDSSFNSSKCNFSLMLKTCHVEEKTTESSKKLSFQNDFELFYLIKMLQFILLVILQPIFCFIGIIHNGLTILVITNKNKKKEFQHSMYRHIIINAVFNIIYCVIMILKLINTCIFYGPSVFCSSVYQEIWAQNLKIILIHFLGNAAKFCSNFSYLIFSASRLLLIEKQKERNRVEKSRKKAIFFYIILLILISFILSLFKLFQYKDNFSHKNANKEFPFEKRDEHYCNNESHKYECKLFNAFKIASRSLNDVLFVILNILIDLILLVKFKHYMDGKLKHISDEAQRKIIEKSKKNINRMILFNGFIYIISHLPEFTMTLVLIIYAKKISNYCLNKFSCDLLNEEAEFFGLISIVFQFYIFKIFDKNFKSSFTQMIANVGVRFFRRQKSENISGQTSSNKREAQNEENIAYYTTNVDLKNLKNLIEDKPFD
jgi:hypothetical protein